jgi:type IV pilus assembly protein PilB
MDKPQTSHKDGFMTKPPERLGDLLIKQGYLKKEELEKALSVQDKERELQNLPIGQILVHMGVLSSMDVDRIINHRELRAKFGNIAIAQGLITKEQLEHCLEKKKPDQLIGQVLVEEGFLDSSDLEVILKEQINSPRFGELAVQLGLATEDDVQKALTIQKSSRRLGEILCDLGMIDPLDFNQCLTESQKQLDFGDTLVHLGYLKEEELRLIQKGHKYGPESLAEVLLRRKLITEEELQIANSRHYNIPFQSLHDFVYQPSEKKVLTKIVSKKYAERKLIIPIEYKNNDLKVGIYRPQERLKAIYELKEMYRQYSVSCVLITKEKFEELFEILYSAHLSGPEIEQSGDTGSQELDMDFISLNIEEDIAPEDIKKTMVYGQRDIEAEELVNFVLSYGITHGASDIHIEQSLKGVKLRYRFDGILRDTTVGWLNEKIQDKALSIISRIKILAGLDIAEKRIPQDGSFRIDYFDKTNKEKVDLDFRVATCRAAVGENITIRILDPRNANVGLDRLNHSPHILDSFKKFLKSPGGMILVCGPTGCGKTSTLYSALQYIDIPDIKIITAEDPIEYHFPSIMQTQVNNKIGITFSKLLRSFLRFDPDVILVGEIRDEETAKIGFDAAQTGHLILSTLHTNDALSSIPRLVDLKVEFGQIASSLMCVLAQRLVRRICPACTEEYMPSEEEWGILFKTYPSHLRFYRGRGCKLCHDSGYDGRILLSEIFAITPEISQALNRGYDEYQISRLALESGMKTMLDDGLLKLKQTTLSEIIRMLPHEMLKRFRLKQQSQKDIDDLIESMLDQSGRLLAEEDKEPSQSSVEISNPETERAAIDLILSRYMTLIKNRYGDATPSIESKRFKAFIVENFYKIYEKQPCKSMTFNIEENPENGRIEVSVIPNV